MKTTAGACGRSFRFEIGGRRFSIYTVMLYAGLVVAIVVGHALARRSGLEPGRVLLAMLLTIPVCLAGSRALAVLLDWRHFRERRAAYTRLDRGGAAMYGGLPPALLVSVPLLAWLGIPFGAFWDVAAIAILAGMIPTRLGCLANGCCAGRPAARFGLRLPNAYETWERRIPVQLAEAALAGALLAAQAALWDARPFGGAAFLFALGGYAAGRFGLDWLREHRGPLLAGLGACQWISLGLATACVVGFFVAAPLATDEAPAAAVQSVSEASAGWSDVAALAGAGLLLLPLMVLFRFLGCHLIFTLEVPTQRVQLVAAFPPTAAQDQFVVTMSLREEPGMSEIDDSPFELPPKAPLPDGTLVFEDLRDVPQGSFTVLCTVESDIVANRVGTCSGTLDAPGLAVIFFASTADLPNVINPIVCFEPAP